MIRGTHIGQGIEHHSSTARQRRGATGRRLKHRASAAQAQLAYPARKCPRGRKLGCVTGSGWRLMTIPGTLYPVSTVRRRTATVPPTVPLKSEALSRRLGASQIPLLGLMYDGSHSWLHRATARDTLSSIVWRSARRPPRPVVRYGGVRCRVLPEHAVRPCHIAVWSCLE